MPYGFGKPAGLSLPDLPESDQSTAYLIGPPAEELAGTDSIAASASPAENAGSMPVARSNGP